MRQLIIIGARAMARETYAYAQDLGISVRGFLDAREDALVDYVGYPEIIATVEGYRPQPDDLFVCALGDPAAKMKYVKMVSDRGGRFLSVIHPTAYVGRGVTIGNGCIVGPHATITCDASLSDHVILNVNASLSHDVSCGVGSTISPGCHVAGRCTLGARVFLGVGVSLIPDTSLGDDVYVAAGAVVTKSFDAGRIMGVPARLG